MTAVRPFNHNVRAIRTTQSIVDKFFRDFHNFVPSRVILTLGISPNDSAYLMSLYLKHHMRREFLAGGIQIIC